MFYTTVKLVVSSVAFVLGGALLSLAIMLQLMSVRYEHANEVAVTMALCIMDLIVGVAFLAWSVFGKQQG